MKIRGMALYERDELVLAIMRKYPHGITISNLAKELVLNKSTTRVMIKRLLEQDKIKEIDFGSAYLYKRRELNDKK